jgi:hypothetical protein
MTKVPSSPRQAVLIVAWWILSLTSAGCGQGGSQARPSVAEGNSLQGPADSLGVLTGNLGQLPGSYSIGAHGQWVFSGDRKLFEAIAAHEDSAVARLVDCLDDTTAAIATVEGRPVSVGVLCYEALRFAAYAEPEGIDSGEWPGTVMPTTTGQGLRDAKAAWLKVVRQRGYRLH